MKGVFINSPPVSVLSAAISHRCPAASRGWPESAGVSPGPRREWASADSFHSLELEQSFWLSQSSHVLSAFLVHCVGYFERCFQTRLFMQMKTLMAFLGYLTLNYLCSYRGRVLWESQHSDICYLKCILPLVSVLGVGSWRKEGAQMVLHHFTGDVNIKINFSL